MTDKELRKLKRAELLEILTRISEENEALREENTKLKRMLESKKLAVQNAGSLAEAALSINGVFESAQAAAEQYLMNIKRQSESAQANADAMVLNAKQKCEQMERDTQSRMDAKWELFKEKLYRYCMASGIPIERPQQKSVASK